jgi:hypothetical protein
VHHWQQKGSFGRLSAGQRFVKGILLSTEEKVAKYETIGRN